MGTPTQVILQCRAHPGGRFTKPAGRRGRNPVQCNPDEGWACSAYETHIKAGVRPKQRKSVNDHLQEQQTTKRVRDASAAEYQRQLLAEVRKPSESASNGRKLPQGAQASKAARDAASELLEGLGWTTAIKGWRTEADSPQYIAYHASLTANRSAETLYLEWVDGKQVASDYAIHDTVKPSNNRGMPEPTLPFDPEEVSDRELIEHISGTKITWWNSLGNLSESAICGRRIVDDDGKTLSPPKVSIEYVYSGLQGPLGVDRLIKFTDGDGGGMRLIKLGALLKVG